MDPVCLDYEEIAGLSLDILKALENNGVPAATAAGALLLTAVRIMHPTKPLESDEEASLTVQALEWLGLLVMDVDGRMH